MLRGWLQVWDERALARLHEAVFHILGHTGMKVMNGRLLDYLDDYGAVVDRDRSVVRFPPEVLEKTIALQRQGCQTARSSTFVTIGGAAAAPGAVLPETFYADFGHATFFLYDWATKQRRRGTSQDFVAFVRLADALSEVPVVNFPIVNGDADPRVEAVESCALLARNTGKPGSGEIHSVAQVKYVAEMAQVVATSRDEFLTAPRLVVTVHCLTSPLTFGARSAAITLELAQYGFPVGVATMPVSGANAPVTPAGTVALAAAEILGGWCVVKAIRRDVETYGVVISGTLDPRSANASFGSPEATLQDIGIHQLFKQVYECPVNVDAAYTDAKVPGIRAAYEKAFKVMALGSTSILCLPIGTLDAASTFCPAQAMVDLECNRGLWRFFRGLEVSSDTLALDVIDQVGPGESHSFLETDHTLRHFRHSLWSPDLVDRSRWQDDASELAKDARLMDRAEEKWRSILAAHEPFVLDEYKARSIDRIVEAARHDLLSQPG